MTDQSNTQAAEVAVIPRVWRNTLRKLAFMAGTSGGTAGPDQGLKDALKEAMDLLDGPYRYADAAQLTPEPVAQAKPVNPYGSGGSMSEAWRRGFNGENCIAHTGSDYDRAWREGLVARKACGSNAAESDRQADLSCTDEPQATSGLVQVVPGSFKPNPDMSTEVPGLTKEEAAQYLGQRKAFEAQLSFPVAQDVTEVMVDAALKAACFHSTAESRKDMRNALQAALKAAAPSPVALQGRDEAVTDEMVDAYLKANDAYWHRTDQQPAALGKWRNGTPREATRESLAAALQAARASLPAGFTPEQVAELVAARDKILAASLPAGKPVLYVSPQQLQGAMDGTLPGLPSLDETQGVYLPVRPTPGGLFTQPLYAAPQPSETQGRRQMTEEELVACLVKASCIGKVKMSFESGPYAITRPSLDATRLKDAIEAFHGIPASPQDGGAA